MATVQPSRTFAVIEFDYGLWWETAVGGSIFPKGETLVVASDAAETTAEYARSAIQFKTDLPSWASDGSVTEVAPILWIHLLHRAQDYGNGLEVATITAAWDLTSSAAHMQAISVGSWNGPFTRLPSRNGGWVGFTLTGLTSSTLRGTYGIMLRSKRSGAFPPRQSYHILKDPAPEGRAYFQYAFTAGSHVDTLSRPDLRAYGASPLSPADTDYRTQVTMRPDMRRAHEDTIALPATTGLHKNVVTRELGWPESWKVPTMGRGAVSVSRDTQDLTDYRGVPVDISVDLHREGRSSVQLARLRSVIGAVRRPSFGPQAVTLEDPLRVVLQQQPCLRDPNLGFEGVEYTAEPALWILADALVNGGGLPWSEFRYDSIAALIRRFATVWPTMTYTTSDIEDRTVGDIVEEVARRYGLCVSRGMSGELTAFHPGSYRPDLRAWDLNLDRDGKGTSLERHLPANRYARVTVEWDTGSGIIGGGSLALTPLPSDSDWTTPEYSIGPQDGPDMQYEAARRSLGRQLAQRFTGPARIIETSVGLRGMVWENGDVIRVTSERYGMTDERYLLVEQRGDPARGGARVTLMQYPDAPGMTSCFEDTESLKGMWRWQDWTTLAFDGSDMGWCSAGGTWSLTGAIDFLNISWEGPIIGMDASATALAGPASINPDATAGTTDLYDLVVGVRGEQTNGPPPAVWPDTQYVHLFRLGISGGSGTEAVIFGIHRPPQVWTIPAPPHDVWSTVDNSFFIGHTRDWTRATIVWTDIAFSPPGTAGKNDNGSAYETWMLHGAAIQWQDSDLSLWIDGIFVGSITGVSKSGYDEAYLMTPDKYDNRVGRFRHLVRAGSQFPVEEIQGRDGIDIYYP